jgi:hypothetical protein
VFIVIVMKVVKALYYTFNRSRGLGMAHVPMAKIVEAATIRGENMLRVKAKGYWELKGVGSRYVFRVDE